MSEPGDSFRLDGRTALVTGSTRGIGHAIAVALANAGASVLVNGRDPAATDACAEAMRASGLRAEPCAFDITDDQSVAEAADCLDTQVDILVNNAGITVRRELLDLDIDAFQRVLDVNLTGALRTARRFVPSMIDRRSGKVVNICSLMSLLARPTTGAYTAAKGGLKMLTQAMCAEWAPHGVQVNAIAPGYVLTDLTRPLADDPDFDAWIRGRTPAGRWASVEEIAAVAVFLASPAASFVNGQTIVVDGGLSSVI